MFFICFEAYLTKEKAFSKVSPNLIVIVQRAFLKFKDHQIFFFFRNKSI